MLSEPDLYHPHLRTKDDTYIERRSSIWTRWFFPEDERVSWCGDIRLYCTGPQYQHVLDTVPGAVTVGTGSDRRIMPMWDGLDEYRLKIEAWLKRKRFTVGV